MDRTVREERGQAALESSNQRVKRVALKVKQFVIIVRVSQGHNNQARCRQICPRGEGTRLSSLKSGVIRPVKIKARAVANLLTFLTVASSPPFC